MRSVRAFVWLVLLSTGCGGGDPGADPADAAVVLPDAFPTFCPGAAPSLEDCFVGDAFADCGGTGDSPLFACGVSSPGGFDECRWFSGGCVPVGYTPSPCPPDDICCLHNECAPVLSCPSPFATMAGPDLFEWFIGFGQRPWDRDRDMSLSVTIDPALAVGATVFTCSDPAPIYGQGPCGIDDTVSGRFLDTLVVTTPFHWFGWIFWMEVDVARSVPLARVCAWQYTDAIEDSCPHYEVEVAPACATSGTLTLDRLPAGEGDLAGLRGSFTADFANGSQLSGSFTLP